MLLLTGATGLVGSALLRQLTATRTPVRCLVRDPRRLGSERVRVQIAIGDLADPPSFRNALRGVDTVVHLAAAVRDQPAGSIEELDGIATWRLVQAAERAGVRHFVFTSALGASAHNRTRFGRAKALAEQAVVGSGLRHTILAPSLVYGPGDVLTSVVARLGVLPVVPVTAAGRALFEPIWAQDVADCLAAVLAQGTPPENARYELAGPERFEGRELLRRILEVTGRPRRLVPVPTFAGSRLLKAGEALLRSHTPLTWDEVELLASPMVSRHGTADAEALGVLPRRIEAVLA